MHNNIFAYTPPGLNPPYLSFNQREDGVLELHVRSETADENTVASAASIELPADVAAQFAVTTLVALTGGERPILLLPSWCSPKVAQIVNAMVRNIWPLVLRNRDLETQMVNREPREAAPDTPVMRPTGGQHYHYPVDSVDAERIVEEQPGGLEEDGPILVDKIAEASDEERAQVTEIAETDSNEKHREDQASQRIEAHDGADDAGRSA